MNVFGTCGNDVPFHPPPGRARQPQQGRCSVAEVQDGSLCTPRGRAGGEGGGGRGGGGGGRGGEGIFNYSLSVFTFKLFALSAFSIFISHPVSIIQD